MNKRLFWPILLLIVLIGGGLRYAGYDFSLPYVDHPDEPNYYLAGLEWRGLFDNQGYYDGVPPGYIALHTLTQPALEALGIDDLADTVRMLRLLAAAVDLLTLTLIAWTARRIAGDLAGLVAGAAWAVSPAMVENGIHALPDPFVYVMTALAYALATAALTASTRREALAVASVIAGLAGVVMKYPAVPALLPGMGVALWLALRTRRTHALLIGTALIAGTSAALISGYGVDFGSLQREGAEIRESGLANLLDPARIANNLYYAILPLNPVAFLLAAAAGILAYWRAPRIHIGAVGVGLALIVSIPWLTASYSAVEWVDIRYVLPATAAACVLLGAAVGQIAALLPGRWRPLVALPLIAFVFIPPLIDSAALVADRRTPDRRVELRRWFDANLEPGTILVGHKNHKTFNPIWGGIPHRHWFDWIEADAVTALSPAVWRAERGISYAVIERGQAEALPADYRAGLLHLRDFHAPPARRGPQVSVYRLWRMEHETDSRLGEHIALSGYDMDGALRPGEALTLRLYWRALSPPPADYSLFIHLTPADSVAVLAQVDGAPAMPDRPTYTWDIPGETLISPPLTLMIPPDLPPGRYAIRIGLYDYRDGARLTTPAGADFLLLDTLTLEEES